MRRRQISSQAGKVSAYLFKDTSDLIPKPTLTVSFHKVFQTYFFEDERHQSYSETFL